MPQECRLTAHAMNLDKSGSNRASLKMLFRRIYRLLFLGRQGVLLVRLPWHLLKIRKRILKEKDNVQHPYQQLWVLLQASLPKMF